MLSHLHNFFALTAKHQKPRLAIVLSILITLLSSTWVLFSLASTGFTFLEESVFWVLLGFTLAYSLTTPVVLELTRSGLPSAGFSWIEIGGIPMILTIVFVSPVAGFFVVVISTVVSHYVFRIRSVALLHNVANLATSYLLVGSAFHFIWLHTDLPINETIALTFLTGLAVECTSWFCYLFIRGFYDGEAAIPTSYRSIIVATLSLVTVAAVFAGVFFAAGLFMLTVCLAVTLVIVIAAELLLRVKTNAVGQRALSWGAASAVLELVGEQDDRLRRHSVAVARYMLDLAKAKKMPRGVQELAFMYGLFHDIGLSGVDRHVRVAEEEFLRDDVPPEPVDGESTFSWEGQDTTDDPFGETIQRGKELYGELGGIPGDGMREPGWWRSENARRVLSEREVAQLDSHGVVGGQMLAHAFQYGCLPELIATHHQPLTANPQTLKQVLRHMLAICDRYEALTAIDGAFPSHPPQVTLIFMKTDAGECFDTTIFTEFTSMVQKQPSRYQNGTDIDHETIEIDEFLEPTLPGAFNLVGWLKFGMTTPNIINAYKHKR